MMQQDPNKDIKKPSVKEKLARSSTKKKVGEMGKPSLKAEFEADMQKERDFVLDRAKKRDKDPDWYKKEALLEASRSADKNVLLDKMNKNIKMSKLKSMSKNKLKY